MERWLKAPLQREDGSLVERDRGTPQGSAISPLLANMFLHYAFDAWMAREYPAVQFERYCDDIIVHARSERQALQLRAMIASRLAECGLELNEQKTRIVYCKDDDRRGSHEHTSFDFLSYTFRPRLSKNRFGKHFLNFSPAVSGEAKTRMRREMRSWRVARRSDKTLTDLALMFNRQLQGWINYFGRFYKSMLYPVFRHFNDMLVRWAMRKYKRLRRHKAGRAGSSLTSQDASPACSRTGAGACAPTAGRWEPGELRGSRRVLRAPEGETPSGDSPRGALCDTGRKRSRSRHGSPSGGRPGVWRSTRTRRASSPSRKASTSWDSTSAATAASC